MTPPQIFWGGVGKGGGRHPPCREHSLILPVIQATALAPILVPKFLSKGVGVPPCAGKQWWVSKERARGGCVPAPGGSLTCCMWPSTFLRQSKMPLPSSE